MVAHQEDDPTARSPCLVLQRPQESVHDPAVGPAVHNVAKLHEHRVATDPRAFPRCLLAAGVHTDDVERLQERHHGVEIPVEVRHAHHAAPWGLALRADVPGNRVFLAGLHAVLLVLALCQNLTFPIRVVNIRKLRGLLVLALCQNLIFQILVVSVRKLRGLLWIERLRSRGRRRRHRAPRVAAHEAARLGICERERHGLRGQLRPQRQGESRGGRGGCAQHGARRHGASRAGRAARGSGREVLGAPGGVSRG
mmetsp:Transcript_11486/g.34128  ORF Transcript_11486/g.34128 Transcript_11486/m.34128 type:complete len:253 (+) Transcript_11486:212-970(+)